MRPIIQFLCLFSIGYSWRLPFNRFSALRSRTLQTTSSRLPSHSENVVPDAKLPIVAEGAEDTIGIKEETFKEYPFTNLSLPVLSDSKDYWSGKYGNYFWHQNRDQLYIFIPVDDSVSKSDISVVFNPIDIDVSFADTKIHIECPHNIGPSGCFWVLEHDIHDNKYILLELEKRVGYINWSSLFSYKHPLPGSSVTLDPHKAAMVEKFFAANQGLAKLNGVDDPQTMESMMNDPDFMSSLPTVEEMESMKEDLGKEVDEKVDEIVPEKTSVVETETPAVPPS